MEIRKEIMTQYYIENKEGKIFSVDDDLQRLKDTLLFMPEYTENDIKKCKRGYVIKDFEIMTKSDFTSKELQEAKDSKYKEALQGAKDYIANEAYYRFDDNNTIEATDGNIGKLTAYALGLQASIADYVTWTSKEDNVLTLNAEQVAMILQGLGAVQADIWNIQFVAYKNEIENAETKEDVDNIEIVYNSEGVNDNKTDTTEPDSVSNE